jgi:Ca2+-binding EF-hand superfamily protein
MKILIKFVSSEHIDDLKEIFQQLDTEHTGCITPAQLEAAFRDIGLDLAGDEIGQIVSSTSYLA